ncbi:MAG: 30S ribosomal protein S15 [Chitinophagales bacterium]|jgi:small subunit ribosomal protein S15|nr:30S ribosomal protein S15 [Chitinophagales bacterium]
MPLTKERKIEIFAQYGGSETNTGSAEAQIALMTTRITMLTEHLKTAKKDNNTTLSLMKLVGKRRSLLDYLKKKDINRYREIVKKLNLRR